MGTLGDFQMLHYFRNCEIKNTGLINCFLPLQEIFTRLLCVCIYTQLEPFRLGYYLFLAWWDQIKFIRVHFGFIQYSYLHFIAFLFIVDLRTWFLRRNHDSCHTLYVPRYGIFSDSSGGAFMCLFTLRTKKG